MSIQVNWNEDRTICILNDILEVHLFDKSLYGNVSPRQAKNLLRSGYIEDEYLTCFNIPAVFVSTLKTTIHLPFGYSIMIFKLKLSPEWQWNKTMKYVIGE